MNIFVEGIFGSGTKALMKQVLEDNKSYLAYYKDDYSLIEICDRAYFNDCDYKKLLVEFDAYRPYIIDNTIYSRCNDNLHYIVDYEKMNASDCDFNEICEKHKLFGGNYKTSEFMKIILSRYSCYYGDKKVFESFLLGKILDEILLYSNLSNDEIITFYSEIIKQIKCNCFVYYVETDNIKKSLNELETSEKEKILTSFKKTKYAKKHCINKIDDLVPYYKMREKIEKEIISKVFSNRCKYF